MHGEMAEMATQEVQEEPDAAALSKQSPSPTLSVVWDIIYSNTYNLPVLYFNAYRDSQPVHDLETLHAAGILKHTQHISITDHPLSSLSCYYIHPCNLSNAVAEIMAADASAEYDKVWRMIIDTLVYIS